MTTHTRRGARSSRGANSQLPVDDFPPQNDPVSPPVQGDSSVNSNESHPTQDTQTEKKPGRRNVRKKTQETLDGIDTPASVVQESTETKPKKKRPARKKKLSDPETISEKDTDTNKNDKIVLPTDFVQPVLPGLFIAPANNNAESIRHISKTVIHDNSEDQMILNLQDTQIASTSSDDNTNPVSFSADETSEAKTNDISPADPVGNDETTLIQEELPAIVERLEITAALEQDSIINEAQIITQDAPSPKTDDVAGEQKEQKKGKSKRRRSGRKKSKETVQIPDADPDSPELQMPDPEPVLSQTRPEPLPANPSETYEAAQNRYDDNQSAGNSRNAKTRNSGLYPSGASAPAALSQADILMSEILNLLGRASEVLASPEITAQLVDSIIYTDENTGERSLRFNIPVSNRETVVEALNLFAKLFHYR